MRVHLFWDELYMIRRIGLALFLMLPAAGLVVLFAWKLIDQDSISSGFAVNDISVEIYGGEVTVRPFSLTLLDGQEIQLSDYEGSIVMVDFWSSWCPPCVKEAAVLQSVYAEYEDRGIEFLGIAIWDDDQQVRKHLEEYGVTYPNGLDVDGAITVDYGIAGIPEKVFIGPSGEALRKFVGPFDEDSLKQVLDDFLGKYPMRSN